MAYVKQTWVARAGTFLNRFTKSNETPTSVELVNAPGTLSEPGTPFSVERMNHMEDGIEAAAIAADLAKNRLMKELRKEVGEVFSLVDRRQPVAYTAGSEDLYFPALCLTDIASYLDISDANWPDLVPKLRALKSVLKHGLSGEISSPVVSSWAISSNVATLTFQNDADHIAFLTALAEDQVIHGSYTDWRTITLPVNIGTITSGTYAITAITPASRTVSFAFTSGNASGSVTSSAEFYSHRIAGSTSTARVWTARGLALRGANDDNGYFVSGGLRRRGYGQGHVHNTLVDGSTRTVVGVFSGGLSNKANAATGTGYDYGNLSLSGPISDGTNGTPRTSKETHGPALSVHLYIHGGRYVA